MSWTDSHERKRRHMIQWDARPMWKKVVEWPFRKFYLVNYDPFVSIPEDEFVWPAEQDPAYEDKIATWGLCVFIVVVGGGFWLVLFVASYFFG